MAQVFLKGLCRAGPLGFSPTASAGRTLFRSTWIQSRACLSNGASKTKDEQLQPQSNPGSTSTEVTETDFEIAQEFPVSAEFFQPEILPELPIKTLNIENRIERVEKKGSFASDMFAGKYDTDFLVYPDVLRDRNENQQLKTQMRMVRQMWPKIWNDSLQLQHFNFHNLFQLSVSEMMTVFEGIGAASRECLENPNSENLIRTDSPLQAQIAESVISLITRNCLTYWPIHKSDNKHLKELLPQRHLLFGGSESLTELIQPIGFCWSEQVPRLGNLPPQEWQTMGQDGGEAMKHFLINGRKTRVHYHESTDNYLLFFRDKFLSDKYREEKPTHESNPASDPFMACCLVKKSEMSQSAVYKDSVGLSFVDFDIDHAVPYDRILFKAGRNDPKGLNIKALGQVATSAVTLGLLKESLRRVYKYLLDNKIGILNCDIIEKKLSSITSRIFAIESVVYYLAGMYDGLQEGFDAHLEATILKIVTNEYAYQVLQELQQVCGSQLFILSKLQDQINIYDSFLDGNIFNRIYLATMGVLWYARNENVHLNRLRLAPWYPGYFFKNYLKERSEKGDWLTIDADIYGNLHPSLKDASVNLEYVIKRIRYAAEMLCMKHGQDITAAQSALYHLSQIAIDSFVLTTLCARASKSYCNGSRNSDMDVAMATIFSDDLARRVRIYMEELQVTPITSWDHRAPVVNELNLKLGGYYAESPLDPNI